MSLGGHVTPEGNRFSKVDFLAVAVSVAFFILNLRIMSGNGVLPGNDPGVHLRHVYEIIESGRISFEEFSLTLPLFHVLVAMLLNLTGAIDVLQAAFLLKILMSLINALTVLAVYLFCRWSFGKVAALLSSIFVVLSVPFMEIISWGGYPNMMALLYITLLFYFLANHYRTSVNFFLISLMALTLFLLHYLSAFVFVLIFVPIFFVKMLMSRKERKNILILSATFLSLIIAAGIWYYKALLPYLSVAVYHLFFEMTVYTYTIPFVTFEYFLKFFGATLFLAIIGIPIAFLLTRHEKRLGSLAILVTWIIVPVLLSQSYLFGLYLLYPRFLYYLIAPLSILSGVTLYGITRVPSLLAPKMSSFKIGRSITARKLLSACVLIIIVVLLASQFMRAFPEVGGMPSYYDVCPLSGYDAGTWLKGYSSPDAVIVAADKPGSWIHVTSQRESIEELSPIFGKSKVADIMLSLSYEMSNYHTLVRRQTPGGYVPSLDIYVSVYDMWQRVLRIPDDGVYVSYDDASDGKTRVTASNSVEKRAYWGKRSSSETLLVLEDSFNSLTLQRTIALRKDSQLVEVEWRVVAHEKLSNVELRVDSSTNPSFHFNKAIVPGVLDWGNPWDKPSSSSVDESGGWAVVEYPPNKLTGDYVALVDDEDYVPYCVLLTVLEFDTIPDWLNVGALGNRLIDSVRVSYTLGDMEAGENRTVYSSILTQSPNLKVHELSDTYIKELLRLKVTLAIRTQDYLTCIRDNNIRFVVADPRFISPDFATSPFFNKVYDNGRFAIYASREGPERG